MNKFFGHIKTVAKHKHYVFIHCVKAGIPWRGVVHDLSKFSPTEFFTSVKFYTGVRSPIPYEREKYGYSKVWIHHFMHNKHHMEHWLDNALGKCVPAKMPLKYIKEMFCDMLSANKVYKKAAGIEYTDSAPLEYFREKNVGRMMHKDSGKLIEELFIMLAEKGEKDTFRYIRRLKNKDY